MPLPMSLTAPNGGSPLSSMTAADGKSLEAMRFPPIGPILRLRLVRCCRRRDMMDRNKAYVATEPELRKRQRELQIEKRRLRQRADGYCTEMNELEAELQALGLMSFRRRMALHARQKELQARLEKNVAELEDIESELAYVLERLERFRI